MTFFVPEGMNRAERAGYSRREFLEQLGKYAALAGAASLAAGCGGEGGNGGGGLIGPSKTYQISGQVVGTVSNDPFLDYKITFDGQPAQVAGGRYSAALDAGSHRVRLEPVSDPCLSPAELTINVGADGNYNFDMMRADPTMQKFMNEIIFGTGKLRRWIVQPTFVIDAGFPQQFIDGTIKDVIHNDVPAFCKGRLYSLRGDDSVIEISNSMPDQSNRPINKIFIYNGPAQIHGETIGTPDALNNGMTIISYRPNFTLSQNRAIASQEILQNLGPGNDSTDPATGKDIPTLPTIFDDFVINRGIDRPTDNDLKVGYYLYSREPGTKWPDSRP